MTSSSYATCRDSSNHNDQNIQVSSLSSTMATSRSYNSSGINGNINSSGSETILTSSQAQSKLNGCISNFMKDVSKEASELRILSDNCSTTSTNISIKPTKLDRITSLKFLSKQTNRLSQIEHQLLHLTDLTLGGFFTNDNNNNNNDDTMADSSNKDNIDGMSMTDLSSLCRLQHSHHAKCLVQIEEILSGYGYVPKSLQQDEFENEYHTVSDNEDGEEQNGNGNGNTSTQTNSHIMHGTQSSTNPINFMQDNKENILYHGNVVNDDGSGEALEYNNSKMMMKTIMNNTLIGQPLNRLSEGECETDVGSVATTTYTPGSIASNRSINTPLTHTGDRIKKRRSSFDGSYSSGFDGGRYPDKEDMRMSLSPAFPTVESLKLSETTANMLAKVSQEHDTSTSSNRNSIIKDTDGDAIHASQCYNSQQRHTDNVNDYELECLDLIDNVDYSQEASIDLLEDNDGSISLASTVICERKLNQLLFDMNNGDCDEMNTHEHEQKHIVNTLISKEYIKPTNNDANENGLMTNHENRNNNNDMAETIITHDMTEVIAKSMKVMCTSPYDNESRRIVENSNCSSSAHSYESLDDNDQGSNHTNSDNDQEKSAEMSKSIDEVVSSFNAVAKGITSNNSAQADVNVVVGDDGDNGSDGETTETEDSISSSTCSSSNSSRRQSTSQAIYANISLRTPKLSTTNLENKMDSSTLNTADIDVVTSPLDNFEVRFEKGGTEARVVSTTSSTAKQTYLHRDNNSPKHFAASAKEVEDTEDRDNNSPKHFASSAKEVEDTEDVAASPLDKFQVQILNHVGTEAKVTPIENDALRSTQSPIMKLNSPSNQFKNDDKYGDEIMQCQSFTQLNINPNSEVKYMISPTTKDNTKTKSYRKTPLPKKEMMFDESTSSIQQQQKSLITDQSQSNETNATEKFSASAYLPTAAYLPNGLNFQITEQDESGYEEGNEIGDNNTNRYDSACDFLPNTETSALSQEGSQSVHIIGGESSHQTTCMAHTPTNRPKTVDEDNCTSPAAPDEECCNNFNNLKTRTPLAAAWISKHMSEDKDRLLKVLSGGKKITSIPSPPKAKENRLECALDMHADFTSETQSLSVQKDKVSDDSTQSQQNHNVSDNQQQQLSTSFDQNMSSIIEQINIIEYESSPRVVKMQVRLDELNQAVKVLNNWVMMSCIENNITEYTKAITILSLKENEANLLLEKEFESGRKAKSVLMSLCFFRRVTLQLSSESRSEKNYVIPLTRKK